MPDSMADAEMMLQRHLDAGEAVLWAGRPRVGRLVRQALPLAGFGVPFTAFSLFWIWAASGMGGSSGGWSYFGLFGLPFVAVGLGLLSSPLWAALRARRTIYAITERRAVVLRGGATNRLIAIPPEAMVQLVRVERADGSGDLLFPDTFEAFLQTMPRARPAGRLVASLGFYGIEDVRRVEDIIRTQLLAHLLTQPPTLAPSPFKSI